MESFLFFSFSKGGELTPDRFHPETLISGWIILIIDQAWTIGKIFCLLIERYRLPISMLI